MLKKLAAVLIAATVVGAPMVATAQPVATQNRTVVKVVKPHKVVVVKHAAHRHHVKRVKVVSGHRHGHHVTVVKHRKPIKHVHRHDGSKTVVIKKVTRTY